MKIDSYFVTAALACVAFCSETRAATITVNQHNPINASVVAVIGNATKVVVTQSGIINGSAVGQIGGHVSATVTQNGQHNVSAIVQHF